MKTILVVEDHKETLAMIKGILEEEFNLIGADSLKTGLQLLYKHKPDLVILDLNLPDGNGLEICREIRDNSEFVKTPVIVLTGQAKMLDKKRGFAAGVDQYLTKPIAVDELEMWVKALLKRVELDSGNISDSIITVGSLEMDIDAHLLKFDGKVITGITGREFKLLHILARNTPKVLSRQYVLSKVWETVAVSNLVDTHLYNLRKKLPKRLAQKIQSVSGKGFRYFEAV